MCGRYSITTPLEAMRRVFNFRNSPNFPPRYNVAPTQDVPVVRPAAGGGRERELVMLRWGLVPFWAKDLKIGVRCINARAETLATAPAFRDAFGRRRCLVVADGYYEWEKLSGGKKQPWRFVLKSGEPFGFAGLWERWNNPEGRLIETCAIVTGEANEATRPVHDRMPVILKPEQFEMWLDPAAEAGRLQQLLRPYPADEMRGYPVNPIVSNVRNETPACIAPA